MNSPPPIPSVNPSPSPAQLAPAAPVPPPNLAEFFMAFAKVSLAGFGGVLAWSRRMMIEERR